MHAVLAEQARECGCLSSLSDVSGSPRSGHKRLVSTTCQVTLLVQEAEEQLDEGQVGFIPEASAMTHKQVLEMAVAEASRRVHEATKYAHCTTLVLLHQGNYTVWCSQI